MRLYLVRHGETDWNRVGRIQGRLDVDINLFGVKQAHLCAKRLKHIPFDKAFTSPLARAVQTAEIINQHHQLRIEAHKDLEEIHLGNWEGMTWSEINRSYRTLMTDMQRERKMANIHGGESYEDVIERSMGFIESIKNHPYEHILVVSHGGVIKSILSHVLGLSIEKRSNFNVMNTSMSILEYHKSQERWRVVTMNDHSHLESLLFDF